MGDQCIPDRSRRFWTTHLHALSTTPEPMNQPLRIYSSYFILSKLSRKYCSFLPPSTASLNSASLSRGTWIEWFLPSDQYWRDGETQITDVGGVRFHFT